jgi:hypothetical protein
MRYAILFKPKGERRWKVKEEITGRGEAVDFVTLLRKRLVAERVWPAGKFKIKPLGRKRKLRHNPWKSRPKEGSHGEA